MIGKQLIVNLWRSFGTYWQICGPMFWRERRRVISDTWTIIGWIKLGGEEEECSRILSRKTFKRCTHVTPSEGGGSRKYLKMPWVFTRSGRYPNKKLWRLLWRLQPVFLKLAPPPICLNKIFIFRVNFKSIPWMLFNPGWTSGKSFVGTSSFSFSSRNSTWLH